MVKCLEMELLDLRECAMFFYNYNQIALLQVYTNLLSHQQYMRAQTISETHFEMISSH